MYQGLRISFKESCDSLRKKVTKKQTRNFTQITCIHLKIWRLMIKRKPCSHISFKQLISVPYLFWSWSKHGALIFKLCLSAPGDQWKFEFHRWINKSASLYPILISSLIDAKWSFNAIVSFTSLFHIFHLSQCKFLEFNLSCFSSPDSMTKSIMIFPQENVITRNNYEYNIDIS